MPSMPEFRAQVAFKPTMGPGSGVVRLIHHGYLAPVRGIEALLEVRAKLGDRYSLTLMGPGDPAYIRRLRDHPLSANMVDIRSPAPPERVVEEVSAFDLGLVAFFVPHFHCRVTAVPNKFWDCLQARVPVVVLPDSAMASIVQSTGCGWVASDNSLDAFVARIVSLTPEDLHRARGRCELYAWIHSRDSWLTSLGTAILERVREHALRSGQGVDRPQPATNGAGEPR
jgi:hypothetical protein